MVRVFMVFLLFSQAPGASEVPGASLKPLFPIQSTTPQAVFRHEFCEFSRVPCLTFTVVRGRMQQQGETVRMQSHRGKRKMVTVKLPVYIP
jgi:hypothetical protein